LHALRGSVFGRPEGEGRGRLPAVRALPILPQSPPPARPVPGAEIAVSLTHADIAEILRIIDASTLDEVIVEVGDVKVEVRRKGAASTSFAPAAAPAPAASASSEPAPAAPPAAGVPVAPADGVEIEQGQEAVRSPMVGTFYRGSSPEEPPFVEVGSEVDTDSPLCLVEVMKLYTTIYAKRPGRVARICAEDAELVEYDQVLFVIDPI
jgi:acetyl-CoA carboxylase biotin carboxyl carrier protein